MNEQEIRQFLLSTPRTGKLASVRADGRPHVAPIWFDLDGDEVVFTTWHTTVKAANIHRDGRVALCVDDEQPPYAFVIFEGRAEIQPENLEELRAWAGRIAGRYMGADQADAFGQRNGVPGELLVRLKPERIVAQKAISE